MILIKTWTWSCARLRTLDPGAENNFILKKRRKKEGCRAGSRQEAGAAHLPGSCGDSLHPRAAGSSLGGLGRQSPALSSGWALLMLLSFTGCCLTHKQQKHFIELPSCPRALH